jgi:hypothetical protein
MDLSMPDEHYHDYVFQDGKLKCECGAERELDERCKDGRHCFCSSSWCCWCGQHLDRPPVIASFEPRVKPECSVCVHEQEPSDAWPCSHCSRRDRVDDKKVDREQVLEGKT